MIDRLGFSEERNNVEAATGSIKKKQGRKRSIIEGNGQRRQKIN
jgi:hypothetical protein